MTVNAATRTTSTEFTARATLTLHREDGDPRADYGVDAGALNGDRSMANPELYGDPDHYSAYRLLPGDNGGVHTNSGIPNHAFFLAIEGGTNRTSGVSVQGVGAANREQIEEVFYRAFTLLMLVVLGTAAAAFAQTPVATRGFIVVNGGYQLTTNDFDDCATFSANAEDGHFTTDYGVKGGPVFDVAGGAVLWRRLGLGVGVTRFSRSTPSYPYDDAAFGAAQTRLRSHGTRSAGRTHRD